MGLGLRAELEHPWRIALVLIMRTVEKTPGGVLFGQTRGRVLALLYGAPDQSFYVRQIAKRIETSVGSVQRELATLAEVGLIERSATGMQVFYKANRNHPVFDELRSLVAKTSGIFDQLRSALAPLAKQIFSAFVYGSIARREDTAQSDVDLMVIGDVTLDDVLTQLSSVEQVIGRTINPSLFSLGEFKSKIQEGNHFVNSVMRGKKVFLIGGQDELGNMG